MNAQTQITPVLLSAINEIAAAGHGVAIALASDEAQRNRSTATDLIVGVRAPGEAAFVARATIRIRESASEGWHNCIGVEPAIFGELAYGESSIAELLRAITDKFLATA